MLKILKILTTILFFVLVVVAATHSLNSINQDIGRHLKSGEIIWETKSVYKTNLFSYTEPNHPFINHHWLSEVIFYLLNGLIGLKGLILFKAGILISTFLLLWLSIRRTASEMPFLIVGVFGLLIFSGRTDVRPEMFSYLFLSYFLFAIFRSKYSEEYKWLYALPVIQIFWTNMHIYFALGPAIILLFLLDRYIHYRKQVKFVFWVFVATCIATLINPNFINGALAPLTILRDYGYSIVENQNIFFLQDYGIHLRDIYLFQISLIILAMSFVLALKNGHKKITFEFLTAIALMILAGKMIRNLGPYAIVFVPVVASNLSALKPIPRLAKFSAPFLIGLILLFGWLIKSTTNNNFYQWMSTSKKFGLAIPKGATKAVDFVKENRISGPVFNNFDVGSFLIWKMFPQEKVFVDGRPEAYSVDFFSKIYKPMQEDPAIWKQVSEEYKINYIFFAHTDMTPWARTFLSRISQNPDWPLIYLDGTTAIFIKRTPTTLPLIQKFQIKN
ncbi:MAG: hypothetical protein AAB784_01860 [Patescibacteria group bacterium]